MMLLLGCHCQSLTNQNNSKKLLQKSTKYSIIRMKISVKIYILCEVQEMTKETLMQCSAKRRELQQISRRIEALRADARSTKAVCYDNEPKSKGEPVAAVQRYIERLEELSALYEEKKADLMQDIITVERAISVLPSDLRMLIRYRYIDGYKWEQVNEMMYISEPTSKRMHRKALHLLQNDLV